MTTPAAAALARIGAVAAALEEALLRLDRPAVAVVRASLGLAASRALERARRADPVPDCSEPAVARWLEAHGAGADPALVSALAAAGVDLATLEPLAAELDHDSLARVLEWLPARRTADRAPAEVAAAAREVAALLGGGRDASLG